MCIRDSRGAAVAVEVGPARGQPDQQRSAGEWDTYPGGEFGGGYDPPLSRHIAFKLTPVPSLSGRNLSLLPGQETLGTTPKE